MKDSNLLPAGLRYLVVVEKASQNYSAYAPDVPGCVAVGDTVEEALDAMKEALEFHLEGLKEDSLEIPLSESQSYYLEVKLP
jgi:predicted RNase H-like HicB family nuclease